MMQANLRLKERLPPTPKVFPQKSAKKLLPTMYDLPSENQEDPGLPDTFHIHQPQLLRETFQPPDYSPENIFEASDLNLYYDPTHERWYKRPDWFAVLGVPSLYEKRDMRYSYVIWKEEVAPVIVVELLSEDTEKEDLGKTLREIKQPPTKWEVYEQILQIPYYVVFSREKPDKFQIFKNRNGRYQALALLEKRCWFPEIQLGLGVWNGTYYNIKHQWLRWYDAQGQWIPTLQEQREQEAQARLAEKQRADAQEKRAKEEAQARLAEKQRADAEAKARLAAESELIRLKALLAKQGLSDQK